MYKTCPDCGKEFFADETWKVRCLGCWKAQKQREGSFSSPRDKGYKDLEIERLRLAVRELQDCLENARHQVTGGLEVEEFKMNLRKIISLCHPDKHGNSETATDITIWLLGLKESWAI